MNTKSVLSSAFILLTIALSVSSCDKIPLEDKRDVNFLVGTWIVDREKTLDALTDNIPDGIKPESLTGKLAIGAIQKAAEGLISPMDKVEFVFTETDYTEKVAGYNAAPKLYEITGRPGRNQIQTKDAKGLVNIYHRDGKNIWYNLRGQEKLRIYLKPSK